MLRGCYAFLGSIFSFTQCVSEANLKHLKESMLFNEYPLTAGDLGMKMWRMPDSLFFIGFQLIRKGETYEREQRVQKRRVFHADGEQKLCIGGLQCAEPFGLQESGGGGDHPSGAGDFPVDTE